MAVLEIDDVSIVYHTAEAEVFAINRVSLALGAGGSLGLVGESGCGKSTLALAALGLLPRLADISHGTIRFEGRPISTMSEAQLRPLRWRRMAYVPQSALASLVPVHSIRRQFRDTAAAHGMGAPEADKRAAELLRRVELDPDLLDRFPHELSGGMRQRAIIALALLFQPDAVGGRRADHRPRRHRAAPDREPARGSATQRGTVAALHQPRHRRGGAAVRARGGAVRRGSHGGGRDGRCAGRSRAPLHDGAGAILPGHPRP